LKSPDSTAKVVKASWIALGDRRTAPLD